MKKKILLTFGIILMVPVGLFLMDWRLRVQEPPLRKGMTEQEVKELLGEREATLGNQRMRSDYYPQGPDFFGNKQMLTVNITSDGRVMSWHVDRLYRSRPWWLGGHFYD
jgi:hypothetical protein